MQTFCITLVPQNKIVMKNSIFLLFALLTFSLSQSQVVNIPDADFKNSLLNYTPAIDTNHDNQIQVSEALAVTTLNFLDTSVGNYFYAQNTTGLEAFVNLTTLKFNAQNITSLDFSNLTNLQTLEIPYCTHLSSFNINILTNLQNLNVAGNPLTSLNFSALTNLQSLNVSFCEVLTSLSVAGLTNLQNLDVSSSYQLPSLNLTGLTSLRNLKLDGCYVLASLNLNGVMALETFKCNGCYDLPSLDLSGRTNLQTAEIAGCINLTSLNISGLTSLQTLLCGGNDHLNVLDLTGLSQLQTVDCHYSALTTLTTTGANNITHLNCSNNHITSLNVLGMTNLQELNCSENQLTSLNLAGLNALTFLDCNYNGITSLNLSQVPNLITLGCHGNALTSLNLAPVVNTLTSLACGDNLLPTLDVSTLIHLTSLECSRNTLPSLNITNLTNLTNLSCGENNLSSLNVSNNTALISLLCDSNHLTALDIINLPNLEHLNCQDNQLTTINFSNSHKLLQIYAYMNLFTDIDVSQSIISTYGFDYNFSNNPNLTQLYLKNGNPAGINLEVYGCHLLHNICTDDFPNKMQAIQNGLEYYNMSGQVLVSSYCSFVPGGSYNTISGTVTIDNNNNGCDSNDIHPDNFKVKIDDGTVSGSTFSLTDGTYSFYTQAGSFALTPQFNNPYFTVTPTTTTVNFTNSDGSTQTQNYCITPFGIHSDVDIIMYPIQNARPGFDANYVLVYKNKGNQITNGTIDLTFNDGILDFVSANPMTDNQSPNHLSWNYSNLMPFESRTINFTLNVNGPMEIPPVNIDDVLHFTASIVPNGEDETPADNTYNYSQIVRGAVDPNDKTCLEGNTITPDVVGNYLNYVIRFQNTGTYYAENIVVQDVLDATKFDISSLELVASSHPQTTRVTGNKVEFIFENINLPAVIDNEPGSHGYVAFKIKTKSNLVLGNAVQNTAGIYFDYNFPVITNTTSTTVSTLGVHDFENTSVSISPNPVTTILAITAKDIITSIQLFDIQGRIITTKLSSSMETNLDLSQQASGVYLVKVYTDKGMKVQKVIKN